MAYINNDDYYKVLGISKSATEKEIKKAYRYLAMKYHPDKNRDNPKVAEEKFKKVNEAYSILSDKEKRQNYDRFGKEGINQHNGMSQDQAEHVFRTFFRGTNPFHDFLGGQGDFMNSSTIFINPLENRFSRDFLIHPNQYMSSRPNIIKKGTNVIVKNLISNKNMNGKLGIIKNYSSTKNRYLVEIQNGTNIFLKIKNIQQIVEVSITNLQQKTYLNNQRGRIIGFNYSSGRYKVVINDNIIAIEPNKVILNNGTCVKIVNIKKKSWLNGQWGTIKSFDKFAFRYLVEMRKNEHIKVKMNNVRV